MTTDEGMVEQGQKGSEEDAPDARQEHEVGDKTMDPKIAAERADRAAERAESEAREGRTQP
jgi:hypothetical protein